ncbi:MAG: hypothetical protein AABZ23_06385 [Deltaproteobacteria bacterium]
MADNNLYLAVGEEAARGTAETSAVAFIPLLNAGIPSFEADDKKRAEYRGEDTVKGATTMIRMSRKWGATLDIPFFTQSLASTQNLMGTMIKHFFGKGTSTQNGATGQYYHMYYPVVDPFATGSGLVAGKALTLNMNVNEGATQKNWPFVGGRVKALGFEQEAGNHLKMSAEMFGQFRDTVGSAIASPSFPAENLRCDYNNMKLYTGTITRTGTGPDFTNYTFGSATQIKPDKVSLKLENGMEDALRLSGLDYADKTRMGVFKATLEITLDWEDPASGFSSADDFNLWIASASTTNFFLHWDTGTQAGTGDNHQLYIDLPVMQRMGGEPDYSLEKDPMVTLKYEALYDATTAKYLCGILLKDAAAAT